MNVLKIIARCLPLILLVSACTDKKDIEMSEEMESEKYEMRSISPPPAVLEAFTTSHPDAGEVGWHADGENFEVEFEMDDLDMSVVYDANGTTLGTEGEIAVSSLMPSILSYVDSNYADYRITGAEFSESADGSVFEIMLAMGDEEGLELVFDDSGSFVNQSEVEGDKDDDEDGEHGDEEDDDGDEDEAQG
jgi:hypothetical protein